MWFSCETVAQPNVLVIILVTNVPVCGDSVKKFSLLERFYPIFPVLVQSMQKLFHFEMEAIDLASIGGCSTVDMKRKDTVSEVNAILGAYK